MHARHTQSLLPPSLQLQPVTAISWSPDRQRLAAATSQPSVLVFDAAGNKIDKFKTKAADASSSTVTHSVRALIWSPDSTVLIVAQSDGAIFGFRLGSFAARDKKTICSKITTGAPPTCLCWLPGAAQHTVIFGCLNGKIGTAALTQSKPTVVAQAGLVLAITPASQHLWTAHQDGWICRLTITSRGGDLRRIVCHPCAPDAFAATDAALLAAGTDLKAVIYSHEGAVLHTFDHSGHQDLQQFTLAAASPVGNAFAVASVDHLHFFTAVDGQEPFSSSNLHVPHMHSPTALAWHPEGASLCVGTPTGALDVYEVCRQRLAYGRDFEVAHRLSGEAVITPLPDGASSRDGASRSLTVPRGTSIAWLNIFRGRFVAAFTNEALLLLDWHLGASSRVPWQRCGDERFCFEQPEVCIVHSRGKCTLLSYGSNAPIAAFSAPDLLPHTISLHLPSGEGSGGLPGMLTGTVAFVSEGSTIHVQGVGAGAGMVVRHEHDADVDFLDLSNDAKHVLFRDDTLALHVLHTATGATHLLASQASYAQWVPGSDSSIVVGQSPGGGLLVWYGPQCWEAPQSLAVEGEVQHLAFSEGLAEVVVQGPGGTHTHALDAHLMSLADALAAEQLPRAVKLLEERGVQRGVEGMWARAGELAVGQSQLELAALCYGAAGDLAKAAYLRETASIADAPGGRQHIEVAARLAQLAGNLAHAEEIYVGNDQAGDAVRMYRSMHKWDDAIRVASASGQMAGADVAQLKAAHFEWLLSTGQQAAAGEVCWREGRLPEAITHFLKGGAPARAAQVVLDTPQERFEAAQLEAIAGALETAGLLEVLGALLEACLLPLAALDAYQRGHAYQRALTLARKEAPDKAASVQAAWGAWLSSQGKYLEAVRHLLEAGQPEAALDAATAARNWDAAADILQNMGDEEKAKEHSRRLAELAAAQGCLAAAEGFHFSAGEGAGSVIMWAGARAWGRAYAAAVRAELSPEQLQELVAAEGVLLEEAGELAEAEKMYLAFDDPDGALAMWHAHHRFDEAVDLVARVRPDQLGPLHTQLGKQLVEEGDLPQAEAHFIAAGAWQAACGALQEAGRWEDALRVARTHGDAAAEDEVALAWAEALGAVRGVRTLQRLDLLDRAITHGVHSGKFELAKELAHRAGAGHLAAWAHHQHALTLQQQGAHAEAEAAYVACGQPGDAVEMWVALRDYEAAARVAEQWRLPSLPDILAAQAQAAADLGDYSRAEELWVRADLPHQALAMLRTAGRWPEALAFAQAHLPEQAEGVELESRVAEPGVLSIAGRALLQEAHAALAESDGLAAAQAFLRISRQDSANDALLQQIWHRGVEAARSQGHLQAVEATQEAARHLLGIGRHSSAAELLASIDELQEAVHVCLEAQLFAQAKALAAGNAALLRTVQEHEMAFLMQHAGADELVAAGHMAEALEMYVREGRWEQAHAVAAEQGPDHAAACAIRHATAELERGNVARAAHTLATHGAPPLAAHQELYSCTVQGVLSMGLGAKGAESAELHCHEFLRSVLQAALEGQGDLQAEDVQGAWEAVHLTVLHRRALAEGQGELAARLATARLRNLTLLPADKAFFDAGIACRTAGKLSMALAFLNRYLDISEAIDDGDMEGGGVNDFRTFTGIPRTAPLPAAHYAPEPARDEVREWTLSASLDASIPTGLPSVPCLSCQRPLYEASLRCLACGLELHPSALSGYPVGSRDESMGSQQMLIRGVEEWTACIRQYEATPS